MSSVRITQLPTLPTLTTGTATSDTAAATEVFIPVVEGGVTRKIAISSLLQYRTSGTLKQVSNGSSMSIQSNLSTGRATLSFYLPGAVTQFAGSQVPTGWLLCNGQPVSRRDYVNLFSVIDIRYGVGDNRSTFNLPDLRGRVPFGSDTMGSSAAGRLTGARPGGVAGALGSVGGEETHTLLQVETPVCPHKHSVTSTWKYSWSNYEGGNACDAGSCGSSCYGRFDANSNNIAASSRYSLKTQTDSDTSSVTPHINVPPLVFLNYIIKY